MHARYLGCNIIIPNPNKEEVELEMDAATQLPEQDEQLERFEDNSEAYIASGIDQLEAHANKTDPLSSPELARTPERPVSQIAREIQDITHYVNILRGRHL